MLVNLFFISQAENKFIVMCDQAWKGSVGESERGKKSKTTPDTDAKSDRTDNIQEERDDNGGDDDEEDEDNEDVEDHEELMGRVAFGAQ